MVVRPRPSRGIGQRPVTRGLPGLREGIEPPTYGGRERFGACPSDMGRRGAHRETASVWHWTDRFGILQVGSSQESKFGNE